MSKTKEQVDRIIAEGIGRRRNVIVHMASPEKKPKQSLLHLASEAIRKRLLSLSARDLLPVPMAKARRADPARPGSRPAAGNRSLAAQVAARMPLVLSLARLKARGEAALRPLLRHDLVKKAVKEAKQVKAPAFWASKSVALDIRKDDLSKLPDEVPLIDGVYANRLLRMPPVAQVRNLPVGILENQASAWGLSTIGALAAWGAYGARGQGVTIGLLDTGVDDTHPDLLDGKGNKKVTRWAEFDADGRMVPNSTAHDTDLHGTHCAGILVGGSRSGKWIGVAPDARLAVALVLDGKKGGGTDAQILAGMNWAIEEGVDVISMSLGGLVISSLPTGNLMLNLEIPSTYTETIFTALEAGIPVVTAIGNEGSQTTGLPGNDMFAFAVGATDYRDRPAGFSGGRTHIIRESDYLPEDLLPLPYSKPDISAPGVAITSCVPKQKYAELSGTSMATPHVAGAVALLLSACPSIRKVPANERAFLIQDFMTGSATLLGEAGQDHRYGFGRIEVLRAIGYGREWEQGPQKRRR